MRFIAKVVPLAAAVSSAAKLVKDETGMPVLSCVLLEAGDGCVVVSSTDIETSISHRVPAAVSNEGRICVPGKMLAAYLEQLPDVELEIKSGNKSFDLKCGTSQAQIHSLAADSFPTMPLGTTRRLRDMQGSRLSQAVADTGFAAAKNDAQMAVLQGAHVALGENGMCLTATDGYRLARYSHGSQGEGTSSFVVPLAGLQAIARAFKDSPTIDMSTKSVTDSENHLIVDDGLSTVASRLLNLDFPSVAALIDTEPTMSITLDREPFYAALRRAGLMADDRAKSLALQIKNGECQILVRSDSYGTGHEVVSVVQDGSSLDINVNARYFTDILKHIDASRVRIGFAGPFGPIAICAEAAPGSPAADAQYLLMPLKTAAKAA